MREVESQIFNVDATRIIMRIDSLIFVKFPALDRRFHTAYA